jgi:hypothetical protein
MRTLSICERWIPMSLSWQSPIALRCEIASNSMRQVM